MHLLVLCMCVAAAMTGAVPRPGGPGPYAVTDDTSHEEVTAAVVPLADLSEGAVPSAEVSAGAARYHARVGVPEAERIKQSEEEAERRGAGRVVGGLASYVGEHPFFGGLVISLTSGQTSVCGSSLVSATRALTAAHCWYDGQSQAYAMLVVLGSVRLFSGGTRVYASAVAAHAQYAPGAPHYDLAVLTLPYVSTSSAVRPIAMASGSNTYEGYTAEVIGFGRTSDGSPVTAAASLRDVFVPVVSNAACAAVYGDAVRAGTVCSSGAGGRGPCGGDSGGPLILYSAAGNDLLIGVTTFVSAAGCGAGLPAGYQRVSYHRDWIAAQL